MQVREVMLYFSLKYKGVWEDIYEAIKSFVPIDEEEFKLLKEKNEASYVTIVDEEYPKSLKNINRPPFVLYYYGKYEYINYMNTMAVVGSREPSQYGIKATQSVLSRVNGNEVVFVSGLARGIDTIAHKIALENNIPTIAVLGTGIDYCYPKENYELYEDIKKYGLILSEYPYKENVSNKNFSQRNRIITGISRFVFAPDVKDHSGTLISIRFALAQDKDVFVFPCSIFEDSIANKLIQDGAKLIIEPIDIIEEFR